MAHLHGLATLGDRLAGVRDGEEWAGPLTSILIDAGADRDAGGGGGFFRPRCFSATPPSKNFSQSGERNVAPHFPAVDLFNVSD